jgi:hypothetical protein
MEVVAAGPSVAAADDGNRCAVRRPPVDSTGSHVMIRHIPFKAVFVVVALWPAPFAAAQGPKTNPTAETREANLAAYAELLRSDVRAQKAAIITEVMLFTDAEDAKFWPVYREYEAELSKLNDDRLALIREYASNYETLSDQRADRVARRALDLETKRTALLAKYYDRFASVLSARTAARFLQVEHQLLLLLDLQIAASLPIVQ